MDEDNTNTSSEELRKELAEMRGEFLKVPFTTQQEVVEKLFKLSQGVNSETPEITPVVLGQIFLATGIELLLTNKQYIDKEQKIEFLLETFDKFFMTALKLINYKLEVPTLEDLTQLSESTPNDVFEYKIINPGSNSIN